MCSIIVCRGTGLCIFQNAYLCSFSESKQWTALLSSRTLLWARCGSSRMTSFSCPRLAWTSSSSGAWQMVNLLYGNFLIYQLANRSWATQTWCKKCCSFLMQEVELKKNLVAFFFYIITVPQILEFLGIRHHCYTNVWEVKPASSPCTSFCWGKVHCTSKTQNLTWIPLLNSKI